MKKNNIVFNEEHKENILLIEKTFSVLKLSIFKLISEQHPSNILFI